MPLEQRVKDNLAATLALANIFTDDNYKYLSLRLQFNDLQRIQKLLFWQQKNPFFKANPGRNKTKQSLSAYLTMESSIDLFMRYMGIPAYEALPNLNYLTGNVQKLVYAWFKDEVLTTSLRQLQCITPTDTIIAIKNIVAVRVEGYIEKLPGESDQKWQSFVTAVDNDIAKLCVNYHKILSALHAQFLQFRKDHIAFIRTYYDRCMLVVQLEEYLINCPRTLHLPNLPNEKLSLLVGAMTTIKQNYHDDGIGNIFTQLNGLRQYTLSHKDHEKLLLLLIELKPKYDGYRAGEENLTDKQLLQQFQALWPKPVLPSLVPSSSKDEATAEWNRLRNKHRERKNQELETESNNFYHKPSSLSLTADTK